MAMQIQGTAQQKIKPGTMRWGALVLAGLLLLASVAPVGAVEVGEEPASAVHSAPCKGLKPYNNIDELLYQFYTNLESDCLFEMSEKELEKTWDTTILSWFEGDDKAFQKIAGQYEEVMKLLPWGTNGPYGRSKPYKSERDAFSISIYKGKNLKIDTFEIARTFEYAEKKGSLFSDPDYDYPPWLPKPFRTYYVTTIPSDPYACLPPDIKSGFFSDNTCHTYYWLNSDETKVIWLMGGRGAVDGITVSRSVPEYFHAKYRTDDGCGPHGTRVVLYGTRRTRIVLCMPLFGIHKKRTMSKGKI